MYVDGSEYTTQTRTSKVQTLPSLQRVGKTRKRSDLEDGSEQDRFKEEGRWRRNGEGEER